MRPGKPTCMSNHLQPLLRFAGSHGQERWSPTTFVFLPCGVLHQKVKKKKEQTSNSHYWEHTHSRSDCFGGLCFSLRFFRQATGTSDFRLSPLTFLPDGRTMSPWKQPLTKTKWKLAENSVSFGLTQQLYQTFTESTCFYWNPHYPLNQTVEGWDVNAVNLKVASKFWNYFEIEVLTQLQKFIWWLEEHVRINVK